MKEREKRAIGRLFALCVTLIVFAIGFAGCEEKAEPYLGTGGRVTVTKALGATKKPVATPTIEATEPEVTITPELFEPDRELIERLEKMTLEEKVGQMFLVRCPEEAIEGIEKYKVGGYVLFSKDFEGKTKDSLAKELKTYQAASEVPLMFAVDEEGGTVVRVSGYPAFRKTPFLSPRKLFEKGGMELIAADAKEKAELLLSLGITVNLAPVCDISKSKSAFMYERSFGKDAEETADYVATIVTASKEAGLGSVLKHFPGYGDNADTHKGIVYDSRSYETYAESDFKPFLAGIEAGVGAVMVSHNIVQCMDADMPASLSARVHQILREELAFDGVILTDDLYMDAIQDFAGKEAAAVAAVLAGNDMLCCTDFEVQIPAVIAAVEDGRISEEQIDASVLRVLRWKAELDLFTY